jgi:hypothetical protein
VKLGVNKFLDFKKSALDTTVFGHSVQLSLSDGELFITQLSAALKDRFLCAFTSS